MAFWSTWFRARTEPERIAHARAAWERGDLEDAWRELRGIESAEAEAMRDTIQADWDRRARDSEVAARRASAPERREKRILAAKTALDRGYLLLMDATDDERGSEQFRQLLAEEMVAAQFDPSSRNPNKPENIALLLELVRRARERLR